MLKNVAPLGYNPAQHGHKPDKGNPLVKWLQEQDPGARSFMSTPASSVGDGNRVPAWCRPETAGKASLKVLTESFYTHEVKPVIDNFLQKCFLRRPLNVVCFACEHFLGQASIHSKARVAKSVSWAQYQKSYIQPARLYLIQPLVHLLLQARPQSASQYVKRVFQVFWTLQKDGFKGKYPEAVVPTAELGEILTDLLWCIDDRKLALLNSVLSAINTENRTLQLVEFVIRVPLEITERLCEALVEGPKSADDSEEDDNNSTPSERTLKQQPVDNSVLSFESDRETRRLQQVSEEIQDVIRAARLAVAFPRTVDQEIFEECEEADREAQQLRSLVSRLSEMEPHRRDWCEDELPTLYSELSLLTTLPPRTIPGRENDDDGEDERLQAENAALRAIASRGAAICEIVMAGLGPTIERKSAGNEVDELMQTAKLQTILPRRNISELEESDPEIHREVKQLRDLVSRVAEAQPERQDWRRCERVHSVALILSVNNGRPRLVDLLL